MIQLKKNNYKTFSNSLLSWYDLNRRILPWRAPPGEISNPYFVYLSEIMLQQTVVKTVIPYFLKFVRKWPDINALAKAKLHEINSYWAGLGYYSRAKNLHETAKIISNKYDGFFPTDKNSLIALPGIGEYTSSAIMAIAFDRKSNVIDGNVERVFSRFYAVEKPIEESKIFIKNIAEKHLPDQRHGDYAQALMDLGSLICIPKSPRCTMCPLLAICDVGGSTRAKQYPIKLPKKEKEERYGLFFYLKNKDGAVLFKTNKSSGLLANMDMLPSIGWYEDSNRFKSSPKLKKNYEFLGLKWKILDQNLVHIFTHFKLNCTVAIAIINDENELLIDLDKSIYRFVQKKNMNDLALPSLTKKILNSLKKHEALNF